MEDDKPPSRRFVLRQKDIVPIDAPARPGDGTAISVELIHAQNRVAEQKKKRTLLELGGPGAAGPIVSAVGPHVLKPKDIEPLDKPASPLDDEAIDVRDILDENRAAEEASGWGAIKHRKRGMSKRNKDFFLTVVPFDLAVAIAMRVFPNAAMYIFGSAAIVLVTSICAWVMFMVMDDY